MITTRLLERQTVAEGTMAFRLEKPAGFSFKAGQNADFTLLNPPESDAEGNIRTFSLADDPGAGSLWVATRMRDTAFKRVLRSMPLGTELGLEGPHGDMTLPNRAQRTLVLLAGGIGITPFRPMALQAAREHLPHRIVLFYGNRRPEDAAFLDELLALPRQNPNFNCIAVMSEMQKSARSWEGARGVIDAGLLRAHLREAAEPLYMLAGPPAMTAALRATLNAMGTDDDDIRVEEFAGY